MEDVPAQSCEAIVACDFCVVVTANFRLLYVFVVMEHASREARHVNVTRHPTAQWTLQQLSEAIPSEPRYRFLIHDRDSIFSADLDRSVRNLGLRVLKTLYRSPRANAHCERLIVSLRREALDWVIPLGERHLRSLLSDWANHYNTGRPHTSLDPGVPLPSGTPVAMQCARHSIPPGSTSSHGRCSPDCTTNTVSCRSQQNEGQSICGRQWSGIDAPHRKRLPEVLLVRGQTERPHHVDQSAEAERTVEDEAPGILQTLLELALQHVVANDTGAVKVGEEVAKAAAPARWYPISVEVRERIVG